MRTIKELSKAELGKILKEFYCQFETGYDFEEFLKPFLESIGLNYTLYINDKRHKFKQQH